MASAKITLRKFDFIVIGAGAAGSSTAAALAKKHPSAVIGLFDMGIAKDAPVASKSLLLRAAFPWMRSIKPFTQSYVGAEERQLGGRRMEYLRGKCLGGSSIIDSGRYMRGTRKDYEDWHQPKWTFDEMLPVYKTLEKNASVDGILHGHDGPINVSFPTLSNVNSTLNLRFAMACESAGLKAITDLNGGNNEGMSIFQLMVQDGVRVDIFNQLLTSERHRTPNLYVYPEAKIDRLVFDAAGTIVGASVIAGKEAVSVQAKNIICCGGAIETPLLLQRSGIGSGEKLKAKKIPVVVDNPHVGENLIEGICVELAYWMKIWASDRHKSLCLGNLPYLWEQWSEYNTSFTGIFASMQEVGIFVKSDRHNERADLHLSMFTAPWIDGGRRLGYYPGFTVCVEHLYPNSRGYVHLAGDNHHSADIRSNHFTVLDDIVSLDEGVKLGTLLTDKSGKLKHENCHAMDGGFTSPFHQFNADLMYPKGDMAGRAQAAQVLAQHVRGNGELFGTCAMGTVVNPDLSVRGVQGLYIADSSVVPTPMAATSSTVGLAIGARCGQSL